MPETLTIADPTAGSEDSLAVYVHWPFCAAKCPYCDFNSHVRHGGVDQQAFADALVRELGFAAARVPERTVTSVFFGGGTPSLMTPETVGRIIDAISATWRISNDCEITLEANPSSVEADRFAGYRLAGVDRVSLGVQSLRDADLRFLGRLHDVAAAKRAIEIARSTFSRISCDLIYARPGQTLAQWEAELGEMLGYAPDHLSLYQLTIEPETPFFRLHETGKLTIPDDDTGADLFEATRAMCADAGLPAYEVSNHARPGAECRHNLAYWRGGDYVGIGPGAHGRLTVDGVRHATIATRHPESWLAGVLADGHGYAEDTPLSREESGEEFLVMGLRLAEGIDLATYRARSGLTIEPAAVADLVEAGLVGFSAPDCLVPTDRGTLVLNALIGEIASRASLAAPEPVGYGRLPDGPGSARPNALEPTE
ncbi:radical SAM family heme chaperone HemW [Amorphus coralli]|uniref:radical SAM family heme chaperone HemW n=1 Tax=Amorphus coralli TaxID=340680 RepID=UPI00037CC498|nr:radical SAM family heme chaperone HemW [Amorphus coralli]